ncbi:hypothetical protein HY837_00910 [archaeon]|nr:hypothetical protein [archaeon]
MAKKRIKNIHETLNTNIAHFVEGKKYVISENNSREANELREFLLEVHEDSELASFVGSRRCFSYLYDPEPDEETAWYLDWGSSKNTVGFAYRQPVWGMGRGGNCVPFELYNERFYANGKELVDLFPELTASKLEERIKESIIEDKKFKAEN